MTQTYGVFALNGPTIAILAIIVVTLTIVTGFLRHLKGNTVATMSVAIIGFVLAAVLAATLWTLPGVWNGLMFTLFGGVIISVLPFAGYLLD